MDLRPFLATKTFSKYNYRICSRRRRILKLFFLEVKLKGMDFQVDMLLLLQGGETCSPIQRLRPQNPVQLARSSPICSSSLHGLVNRMDSRRNMGKANCGYPVVTHALFLGIVSTYPPQAQGTTTRKRAQRPCTAIAHAPNRKYE